MIEVKITAKELLRFLQKYDYIKENILSSHGLMTMHDTKIDLDFDGQDFLFMLHERPQEDMDDLSEISKKLQEFKTNEDFVL